MRKRIKLRQTRMPLTFCPVCKTKISGATSYEGAVPREGDLSICVECLSFLEYGPGLMMQIYTGPTFPDKLLKMRRLLMEVKRQGKG